MATQLQVVEREFMRMFYVIFTSLRDIGTYYRILGENSTTTSCGAQ